MCVCMVGIQRVEPAKVAGEHQSLCRTAETQSNRWENAQTGEAAKKFRVKRLTWQAKTVFTKDSGL